MEYTTIIDDQHDELCTETYMKGTGFDDKNVSTYRR